MPLPVTDGLTAHWDYNDPGVAVGQYGNIRYVPDLSGLDHHLVQPVEIRRPAPTAMFGLDGGYVAPLTNNKWMETELEAITTRTVFIVANKEVDSSFAFEALFGHPDNDGIYTTEQAWPVVAGSAEFREEHGGRQWVDGVYGDPLSAGATFILTSERTSAMTRNLWRVHNNNTTGSWGGIIAEVIVYDRLLLDAERDLVEADLAVKYSVTLGTPVAAPAAVVEPENGEDFICRPPLNIIIEGSDFVVDLAPDETQALTLLAESNLAWVEGRRQDEQILEVNQETSIDSYFDVKFKDICGISTDSPMVTGESGGIGMPAYCFSTASFWISTLNGVSPDPLTAAAFVVGGICTSIGEFETTTRGYPQVTRDCPDPILLPSCLPQGSATASSTAGASSAPTQCAAELAIFDMCSPCLDCGQFEELQAMLERIKVFYEYIEDLATDTTTTTIPPHPDGGIVETFTGTLVQHKAQLSLWDFLVHESSVKLTAIGQGQSVSIAAFYKNISSGSIGPVDFAFLMEFSRDDVPWAGASNFELRVLDRPDETSATTASLIDQSGASMTITLTTPLPVASGESAYADFVILTKETDLFDDGADYRVLVTVVISPVHMFSGSRTLQQTVFFVPGSEAEAEGSS